MKFGDIFKVRRGKKNIRKPVDYGHANTQQHFEYLATLNNFQSAIADATNEYYQDTEPLQSIYNSIMTDGTVSTDLSLRINAVLNKDYGLFHEDGTRDDGLSQYICEKPHFKKTIRSVIQSRFSWYSAIYFYRRGKEIIDVEDLDRRNILPIHKDGPQFYPTNNRSKLFTLADYPGEVLFVQLDGVPTRCGLLHPITYRVIRKRQLENTEIRLFERTAIPLNTLVTTNQEELSDEETLATQENLKNLPKMGSIILRAGDKVEVVESSKNGFRPLRDTIQAYDMKIDQLILGQTLVTNAGESYAQSKTHHKIYQDILDSDRIAVLDWLNNEYKPFLLRIGYDIPDTHNFDIEFKPNPDAQREKALLLLDRGCLLYTSPSPRDS